MRQFAEPLALPVKVAGVALASKQANRSRRPSIEFAHHAFPPGFSMDIR